MGAEKKLVIGASGFLGSHVTRQLVAAGANVRVMLRHNSSTKGIDDLDVERCYGDVFDDRALRAAMAGCDVVYYCVVDARMWLRDPAPLFRTNVEGLRHVLDAALEADLKRFVYTSTTGTLAISDSRAVTEDDPHNWDQGGAYIEARVAGENLLLSYARDKGTVRRRHVHLHHLWARRLGTDSTRLLLALVANGRFPFYFGYSAEVVGIEDAARAMLLAARARTNRRTLHRLRQLHEYPGATRDRRHRRGRRPPRIGIPMSVLRAGARVNDVLARLLGRDLPFAYAGMRMAALMSPLDHSKAERELGWTPEPVEDSIRKAAVFFASQR